MSREIKFRAWNSKNRYMSTPGKDEDLIDYTEHYLATHDTLMQYTGLHDCNGKEIYEGDIVKSGEFGHLVVIEWKPIFGDHPDEDMCLGIGFELFLGEEPDNSEPGAYEIIGNIWENPELLKGSHE